MDKYEFRRTRSEEYNRGEPQDPMRIYLSNPLGECPRQKISRQGEERDSLWDFEQEPDFGGSPKSLVSADEDHIRRDQMGSRQFTSQPNSMDPEPWNVMANRYPYHSVDNSRSVMERLGITTGLNSNDYANGQEAAIEYIRMMTPRGSVPRTFQANTGRGEMIYNPGTFGQYDEHRGSFFPNNTPQRINPLDFLNGVENGQEEPVAFFSPHPPSREAKKETLAKYLAKDFWICVSLSMIYKR